MASDPVRNKAARLSGLLGLQRNTLGVLAMVILAGMGERLAERFVTITLVFFI